MHHAHIDEIGMVSGRHCQVEKKPYACARSSLPYGLFIMSTDSLVLRNEYVVPKRRLGDDNSIEGIPRPDQGCCSIHDCRKRMIADTEADVSLEGRHDILARNARPTNFTQVLKFQAHDR